MFFNKNYTKLLWRAFIMTTSVYCISKNGKVSNPANIYLFKVNNRNTRKRREICSQLTITAN